MIIETFGNQVFNLVRGEGGVKGGREGREGVVAKISFGLYKI